jgi:hypothetical protein
VRAAYQAGIDACRKRGKRFIAGGVGNLTLARAALQDRVSGITAEPK